MVGPTDVVQPPVRRAARARDACLWHVSSGGWREALRMLRSGRTGDSSAGS